MKRFTKVDGDVDAGELRPLQFAVSIPHSASRSTHSSTSPRDSSRRKIQSVAIQRLCWKLR